MRPLDTERLQLTPIGIADEAAIVAFHADRRVTAYLLDTVPNTPILARIFIAWSMHLNRDGLGVFAVRRRGETDLIGLFTLTPVEGSEAIELGGKLSRRAWGTDIAVEAGAAMIDHAFTTLALDQLTSMFHPDNRAVPAALGRLHFRPDDDAMLFGRTARTMRLQVAEWRAAGARPRPRRLVETISRHNRNA